MKKEQELINIQANELRLLERIQVAELVKILNFNESNMTVDVQPLVKQPKNNQYVTKPPILSVPVAYEKIECKTLCPYDGKYKIAEMKRIYAAGDIGIIVYLNCDSDNSIQTGAESQPNTTRLHSGDDAVFLGVIKAGG